MKPNANTTRSEEDFGTRLIVLLLLMSCLLALPKAGLADTYVSGTISGQTWTTANSPYRVVGNINVALLTINPGVTLLFESNYVFEVDGFLTAIGTAAQPITFACTNGGWQGIFFNWCYDGSELAHCQIRNSLNGGIRCVSADLVIRSCVLANNSSGGSGGGIFVDNHLYPSSRIVIADCTLTNNSSAGEGGALYVNNQS
jgi:predicted outer membrane repeat protein